MNSPSPTVRWQEACTLCFLLAQNLGDEQGLRVWRESEERKAAWLDLVLSQAELFIGEAGEQGQNWPQGLMRAGTAWMGWMEEQGAPEGEWKDKEWTCHWFQPSQDEPESNDMPSASSWPGEGAWPKLGLSWLDWKAGLANTHRAKTLRWAELASRRWPKAHWFELALVCAILVILEEVGHQTRLERVTIDNLGPQGQTLDLQWFFHARSN